MRNFQRIVAIVGMATVCSFGAAAETYTFTESVKNRVSEKRGIYENEGMYNFLFCETESLRSREMMRIHEHTRKMYVESIYSHILTSIRYKIEEIAPYSRIDTQMNVVRNLILGTAKGCASVDEVAAKIEEYIAYAEEFLTREKEDGKW